MMGISRTSTLWALTLVLVALPVGTALAQPPNNDYLFSKDINQPGQKLNRVFEDSVDTTSATWQSDLYSPPSSGGPQEPYGAPPYSCGTDYFFKTVWWAIYPEVGGDVLIQATGFDAVIGLLPFESQASAVPDLNRYKCIDDPVRTGSETLQTHVNAGQPYAIQIGGYSPDLTVADAASGQLDLLFGFFPDRDGDGFYDDTYTPRDECVNVAGPVNGCPDADGDSVPDVRDSGPHDACVGVRGNRPDGCLDSDGDGFIDPWSGASAAGQTVDQCRSVPGPLQGCPDRDGDGIPDLRDGSPPPDKCPNENSRPRDANRNGCLDYFLVNQSVVYSYKNKKRGEKFKSFQVVVDTPAHGARIDVTCSRRRCPRYVRTAVLRSLSGHAARTVKLRLGTLRAGTKVYVRVTASGAVGRYQVVTVKNGSVKKGKQICLRPGSRTPTSNCSTLR